jgi:DNA-binding transcriptional ArsR family regulator
MKRRAVGLRSHKVFGALAHPIRLAILERLLRNPPEPVHELAAEFAVTRPAISLHLRVLRDAGLVSELRRGRERHYQIEPSGFREATWWLRKYDRFWEGRLAALDEHLAKER